MIEVVKQTINSNPPAAGTFTGGISSRLGRAGYLNISISGSSWSATITLQRSFLDESDDSWHDVETFTENYQGQLYDPEPGVIYRIGVKNGEFTSGVVKVRLSK